MIIHSLYLDANRLDYIFSAVNSFEIGLTIQYGNSHSGPLSKYFEFDKLGYNNIDGAIKFINRRCI